MLPVGGTLRGAGDENVGRCFEGVFVEGVGVAIVAVGGQNWSRCGYRYVQRVSPPLVVQVHVCDVVGGKQGRAHVKPRASQVLAA